MSRSSKPTFRLTPTGLPPATREKGVVTGEVGGWGKKRRGGIQKGEKKEQEDRKGVVQDLEP